MREEYELAAKAAGIKIDSWHNGEVPVLRGRFGLFSQWTPLESDADAFRLMVDAGISVSFFDGDQVVAEKDGEFDQTRFCASPENMPGATRKAIFDCAVAIGRGEP